MRDHDTLDVYRLKLLTGTISGKDEYTPWRSSPCSWNSRPKPQAVIEKGQAAKLLTDDRSNKLLALAKSQAAADQRRQAKNLAAAQAAPKGDRAGQDRRRPVGPGQGQGRHRHHQGRHRQGRRRQEQCPDPSGHGLYQRRPEGRRAEGVRRRQGAPPPTNRRWSPISGRSTRATDHGFDSAKSKRPPRRAAVLFLGHRLRCAPRYKRAGGPMPFLTPDESRGAASQPENLLRRGGGGAAFRHGHGAAPVAQLSRHAALLDGIVHLPLVLPPVAMGFILLMIFGTRGGVGAFLKDHFGIVLVFRWTGAVLASTIFTFPFQVRSIRLALEARDQGLDEAARTLGAGCLRPAGQHHPAAGAAGPGGGRDHRLCRLAGGIRRHHHFRFQHSRRDQNLAAGDLYRAADAGRRGRGGAALRAFHRDRLPVPARRPGHHAPRHQEGRGDERGSRHPPSPGRLHVWMWHSPRRGGVTALFGPSGAGKTSIVHVLAGLTRPGPRPDGAGRPYRAGHRERHLRAAGKAPRRPGVPGCAAVSRI